MFIDRHLKFIFFQNWMFEQRITNLVLMELKYIYVGFVRVLLLMSINYKLRCQYSCSIKRSKINYYNSNVRSYV